VREGLQAALREFSGSRHDRDAPGGVPLLADHEGGAGAPQGIHAVELRDARVGGPTDRGADLAGHHVPVRRDRPAAATLGDGEWRALRTRGAPRWLVQAGGPRNGVDEIGGPPGCPPGPPHTPPSTSTPEPP